MSYNLKTDEGTVEAVIDDNCGIKKFYSIANTLSKDLKVKFSDKLDEFHSVDWSFKYKGRPLKLRYNIYTGVSVCPTTSRDNEMVTELATLLERKYF